MRYIRLFPFLIMPFLLVSCSQKQVTTSKKAITPETTIDTKSTEDFFKLDVVREDSDYFYFTLVNNTDTQYKHIMSDDLMEGFDGNTWIDLSPIRSANYITQMIDPMTTIEMSLSKQDGDLDYESFRLTIHLLNDEFGEHYVERVFKPS